MGINGLILLLCASILPGNPRDPSHDSRDYSKNRWAYYEMQDFVGIEGIQQEKLRKVLTGEAHRMHQLQRMVF